MQCYKNLVNTEYVANILLDAFYTMINIMFINNIVNYELPHKYT